MSKSASVAMQGHIAGPFTTLCTCWKITRTDGQIFTFTDHDQDLVVDGLTFKAAFSYTRTAFRTTNDATSDDVDVVGTIDASNVTKDDLLAGKFNHASVDIFVVNWADLTMDRIKLRRAHLGTVTRGKDKFKVQVVGLSNLLKQRIGEVYQPTCRWDFGDTNCGKNLAPLQQTGTVLVVTSNKKFTASGLTGAGPSILTYTNTTIRFRATDKIDDFSNQWTTKGFLVGDGIQITGSDSNDLLHTIKRIQNNITVTYKGITTTGVGVITTESQNVENEPAGSSITVTRKTPGYFDFGKVTWLTGLNAGLKMEVRSWDGTSALELLLGMPYAIQVGDTFQITPGCDKRLPTCKFWGQILNFGGEPFVPGQDAIYFYPNAQ